MSTDNDAYKNCDDRGVWDCGEQDGQIRYKRTLLGQIFAGTKYCWSKTSMKCCAVFFPNDSIATVKKITNFTEPKLSSFNFDFC